MALFARCAESLWRMKNLRVIRVNAKTVRINKPCPRGQVAAGAREPMRSSPRRMDQLDMTRKGANGPPLIEGDEMPNLSRLKDEIETGGLNVRTTRTKLAINGEFHDGKHEGVAFIKKRKGIQLKWHGHIKVEAQETHTCDLGHEHKVIKNKHWVWNYCELSREDVRKLIEFLNEA